MSDPGLFGPESVTWQVNREGVLLLGGGAALIMQVAHPLVGAGVAEHSNYREDPWGRLYRTLELTTSIVFGSTAKAQEASDRLRAVHKSVHGVTKEDGGRVPGGNEVLRERPKARHVGARDAGGHVDAGLRGVRGDAQPGREAALLRGAEKLGEMFGVPIDRQPETLAEFHEYFERMIEEELAVTAALADVVDATMRPELPFVARPLVEAINLATVSLLPDRLRAELGLEWGDNRRRLVLASRAIVRRALPVLPRLIRDFPPARSADRRVAAAA